MMNICMIVYNFVNNGIGNVVLTYSTELVNHGHTVTILVGGPSDSSRVEIAEGAGIAVVQLPNKRRDTAAYFRALKSAFDGDQYDIAHVHGNSGMILPEIVTARRSRAAPVLQALRIPVVRHQTCM